MKTDRTFLPRLTLALFLSYLSVALSLTAVPVYVMSWPGFTNVLAGLAVGIPFLSTIFTRNYAGQIADASGGHRCMRRGLVFYALACGLCLLSTLPALPAIGRYGVLIAGRLLLGLGESLCIVGMMAGALRWPGSHRQAGLWRGPGPPCMARLPWVARWG
nr:MFS transporter [Acetobacter persici]